MNNEHSYIMELYNDDSRSLIGRATIEPDFGPAYEWTCLQAFRKGCTAEKDATFCSSVQPIWHESIGQPYLKGFQVTVKCNERDFATCMFSTTYFAGAAQDASTALIEKDILKPGDLFRYSVLAYPRSASAVQSVSPSRFSFEATNVPMGFEERSLCELVRNSVPFATIYADDIPAFLPYSVLKEAEQLKEQVGAEETGGILVGYLCRDLSIPEVFIVVTEQLPARHTASTSTRLTFTADTWTDIQNAISLRKRGETVVGWWHSHPSREWCKAGSQREHNSAVAGDFFSVHDVALHRTVFPAAYNIGLVVSDSPLSNRLEVPSFALFGWRWGVIAHRGFFLLPD